MSFRYDLTMEIDLVISYVNNNDEIWRKTFIDYCVQINARQLIGKMSRCAKRLVFINIKVV